MKKIQNAYDIENFYNEYKNMRSQKLNANELIEIPIIKTMLPNLNDLSIIDLGCGNGTMSKFFIENGAKKVLGLDISKNMINEANKVNSHNRISYHVLAMENLNKINEKFDLVYSSLAFHYIEDFDKLIGDIYNLLNPGGFLVFSQEHPLNTAPIMINGLDNKTQIDGKRYYYLSDYNNESERICDWNNEKVIKYHRSFSSIVNVLIKHNLDILEVKESMASKEAIRLVEKYKYQKDKPYFLFIRAKK